MRFGNRYPCLLVLGHKVAEEDPKTCKNVADEYRGENEEKYTLYTIIKLEELLGKPENGIVFLHHLEHPDHSSQLQNL